MELDVWNLSASLRVSDRRVNNDAERIFHEVTTRVSRAANRFDETSEISRLNATRAMDMSDDFMALWRAADRAVTLTNGACNPAVLPALLAWGYDRDFSDIDHRDLALSPQVGAAHFEGIHVDEVHGRVELDDGVLLDLGSSAKAWTCDLIADTIAPLSGVAVEIGGDVAVRGASPDGGTWAIGLSDSLLVGPGGPRIGLAHGGVATSSRKVRHWRVNGQRVTHVIDPMTGWPVAGELETVTVTAATCLEANAFSTAALVWGHRDALSRISQHGWSARAVCEDGSVITAGPWPSEETAA